MKTLFSTLILTLFVSLQIAPAQSITTDSWADVEESGSGTIHIVYVKTPAFVYEGENGELTGIGIQIMERFVRYLEHTKKVSLDVEYTEGSDFQEYINLVRNGKGGVFGVANTTITDQRREYLAFSSPFIANIAVLVTHEEVPTLSSMENISTEFAGKTGLAPLGSTHEKRLKALKETYYPSLEMEFTDNSWEALQRNVDNKDTFSYQDIALYWTYKERGMPVRRHEVGDKSSELFGIIMPKGSDWAPVFEEFFTLGSGFKSSPVYQRILVEHLGPDVVRMLEMSSDR